MWFCIIIQSIICVFTWHEIYAKTGDIFLIEEFQIVFVDFSFRSLRLKSLQLTEGTLRLSLVTLLRGRVWEGKSEFTAAVS